MQQVVQEIKNFNEIKNNNNLYLGPTKFMIDEKNDINEYENILKKYLKAFGNDAAFHAIDSETIHKVLFNLYEKNKVTRRAGTSSLLEE